MVRPCIRHHSHFPRLHLSSQQKINPRGRIRGGKRRRIGRENRQPGFVQKRLHLRAIDERVEVAADEHGAFRAAYRAGKRIELCRPPFFVQAQMRVPDRRSVVQRHADRGARFAAGRGKPQSLDMRDCPRIAREDSVAERGPEQAKPTIKVKLHPQGAGDLLCLIAPPGTGKEAIDFLKQNDIGIDGLQSRRDCG